MKAVVKRAGSQSSATSPGPAAKRSRGDRAVAKRFLSLLKSGADTRVSKVKRIRQSVRTRSYENELKLSIALERMVRDL
jgi:hypothetical protein